MLRRALSLLAAAAFAGGALTAAEDAEEGAAQKASNKVCICGKDIGATPKYVSVRDGDHLTTYAVCSERCVTRVKAMDPKEAEKAFDTLNHKK